MNLITRFTILFGIVSLVVFPIGGYITYRVLEREIQLEEQRFLLERYDRIVAFIERTNPDTVRRFSKAVVTPLTKSVEMEPFFSDTIVMHETLERLEPHRKLDAQFVTEERGYHVMIYDLIVESDDIVDSVTESMIKMYVILLGAVILIGLVGSYILFRPFQDTLSKIREFRLSSKEPIHFDRTLTSEFRKLNSFLTEMTDKVRRDYIALKEFSENASHELQTPIAVVQGKLDMLLESPDLTEDQLKSITSAQSAVRRLSKLSNSLSLLTKIENREFETEEELDIKAIVERILSEFEELIMLKRLSLSFELADGVVLRGDPTLIEILLTNLINNSIRHNREEGEVKVILRESELIVQNSGDPLTVDPNELFERFKKSNQSSTSLGLGLAIVKRICDLYGYSISYAYANNLHEIKVTLRT